MFEEFVRETYRSVTWPFDVRSAYVCSNVGVFGERSQKAFVTIRRQVYEDIAVDVRTGKLSKTAALFGEADPGVEVDQGNDRGIDEVQLKFLRSSNHNRETKCVRPGNGQNRSKSSFRMN